MTQLERATAALIQMAEGISADPDYANRIKKWSLKMVYEFLTEEGRSARMLVFDKGRCYVSEPADREYEGCSVFQMHPEVYLKLVSEEMDSRTAVTSGALKVLKIASIPDLLKMRQLMNFAKLNRPSAV